MAKFLNTDLLTTWITRLIEEAERELVIIVPYIKTSERVYNLLKQADARGVETLLIYRESKLSEPERKKLKEISNLNLLHHPNVHAKCYYNGKYLILGSMNLYEYSELNNREMGVLLHKDPLDDQNGFTDFIDSDATFEEAIAEIKNIINGSEFEKQSRETIEEGFEMDIIKTSKEFKEEFTMKVNKVFLNKKFTVENENGRWISVCRNYFDKVDVILEHRIEIIFNRDEAWLSKFHEKIRGKHSEFMIEGFKFYLNYKSNMATLYDNQKHPAWEKMDKVQSWQFRKEGLDKAIRYLRNYF